MLTGKGLRLLSRMSGESHVERKPKRVPGLPPNPGIGRVERAQSRGKLSKMRRKK